MPTRRIERVNDLIRAEISELIAKEIKDPRLGGMISVTQVETAPDLRFAKVYVSVMGSDQERSTAVSTLQRAAGFFRRELRERLTMRRTPELAFELDTSIERGDRIMRLLKQIHQEESSEPTGDNDE